MSQEKDNVDKLAQDASEAGRNNPDPIDGNPPAPTQNPAVDSNPQDEVELAERPLRREYLNDMAELESKYGVTSDQLGKSTTEYSQMYAESIKQALSSGVDGVNLAFLDKLEESSKRSRMIRDFLRQGLLVNVSAKKFSVEFKSLRSQIKKVGSVKEMLQLVSAFPETAPEYQQVMVYFSNAMSMLLYGQGNLQADFLKTVLKSVKTTQADGTEITLAKDLEELIGEEVGLFENQNSDPAQKVAARITTDVCMFAASGRGIDLRGILDKMKKQKPVVESTHMPKQVVDALSNFEGFKSGLDEARKALHNSRAKTEAIDKANRHNAGINTLLLERKRDKKAKSTEKTTKITELQGLPAGDPRRAVLQAELQQIESELTDIENEINQLNAELKQIGNQDIEASEQENLAIANLGEFVTMFFAYIKKVRETLKIDLDKFSNFLSLKGLIENDLSVPANRTALINFLNPDNMLGLEEDLLKFKELVVQTRPLTQEEYSVMLLTEFYAQVYPNFTKDTINLMATSHYVRLKKENNLQEFKRKMLYERSEAKLRGVEKRSCRDIVKLIARDRITSLSVSHNNVTGTKRLERTEVDAVEQINADMSLRDLRDHVSESGISMDSLNYLMYNLASFFVPRKLTDGSMVTISNAVEIAKAETIMSNINKLLSEYAALKVLDKAKSNLKEREQITPISLAAALKAYNTENEEREQSILVSAGRRAAHIMSKSALKQRRKEILKVAREQSWSKARLDQELKAAGIDGFNQGAVLSGFMLGKGINGFKAIGKGLRNTVKKTWEHRKEIAEKITKIGTAPFRLVKSAVQSGWKGTKFVGRQVAKVPGIVLGGLAATTATATAVLGTPFAIINAMKAGVSGTYEAGKNRAATQRARIHTKINDIINPSNN